LAYADQLQVERSERLGPGDAVLVGVLLDRCREQARRSDPVAPHQDRVLLPRLVEVGGSQGLRVARAELEDVADLDRRLDPDRSPERAAVAGLDDAHVGEERLEVAAGLDAPNVPSV